MSYFANMFTGIIESTGVVKEVISNGSNKTFWVESPISGEFKIDQSVSHNGICLTIEEIRNKQHRVTAIAETIKKTNIGSWDRGTVVNLERSLMLNQRVDGHLVQGHIDTTAICLKRKEKKGSWEFKFVFPKKFSELIIEKGSICVNGVSLTAFNVKNKSFCVALIPYTIEHTNLKQLNKGDKANIEFDMVCKYIIRSLKR